MSERSIEDIKNKVGEEDLYIKRHSQAIHGQAGEERKGKEKPHGRER